MTVHTNSNNAPQLAISADNSGTDANGTKRLTYQTPRLQRLGSVRDLTLGSTGGSAEFGMMASAPM
jgi:hypothetical protein